MSLLLENTGIDTDIKVVRVSGNMTFEETDAFASLIRVLLNQGAKRIILDLSAVEQIDSLGGVSIIRCFFAAREAAAELYVAGAGPRVTQLFKTTQVDTLIPFFPTMSAAQEVARLRAQGKSGEGDTYIAKQHQTTIPSFAADGDPIPEMKAPAQEKAQIARLAYSYWQARGCPEGSPEEDWLRAEVELGKPVAGTAVLGIRG